MNILYIVLLIAVLAIVVIAFSKSKSQGLNKKSKRYMKPNKPGFYWGNPDKETTNVKITLHPPIEKAIKFK